MAAIVRYLRNSAFYYALRPAPRAQDLHQPLVRWDVSRLPEGAVLEHPLAPGLWLIRRCLDLGEAGRIKALFSSLDACGRFPWHRYELGRGMMPLHASPPLDDATTGRILTGLEVFGEPGSLGADPVGAWPRLCDLLASRAEGARELEDLQRLPQRRIEAFAGQPCLFIQAQTLEGGAEVTAHRDALPYGGDMIASAVVEGRSDVRVGPVRFPVEPGDLYAIAGPARYDMEHEVMASPRDRFSLTFRYGLGFPEALPELAAVPHEQGELYRT